MEKTNGALSPTFYAPLRISDFGGRPVTQALVVSDLHLCEGRLPESLYLHRLENFTADEAFAAFLKQKREQAAKAGTRTLLVINGDFIDFPRIVRVPQGETDLLAWQEELENIPAEELHHRKHAEMLADFSEFDKSWRKYILIPSRWRRRFWFFSKTGRALRSETRYGLRTQDFKSIYRMKTVYEGHREVFQALADWLKAGFPIVMLVGNHDPEMEQELVQAWLHAKLANIAGSAKLLQFHRDGIELDRAIRIEHGHRFEWHTATRAEWLDPKTQEVFMPAGSLFNRYLVNKIEFVVPYLDNVRPNTRVVTHLLHNKTVEAFKLTGTLLKTICRLIGKKGASKLIGLGALNLLSLLLPVGYLAWVLISKAWHLDYLVLGFSALAVMGLVLLLRNAAKKLSPHFSLVEVRKRMTENFAAENGRKHYAVCGHTHSPESELWKTENVEYINSGTWVLIFEYESGVARDDLTKTFVEFNRDEDGDWQGKLKRWAPRPEGESKVILIEPRSKKKSTPESTNGVSRGLPVEEEAAAKAKPNQYSPALSISRSL